MERQDETSGAGCHGTFGIHFHNDLFCVQGPDILSEIAMGSPVSPMVADIFMEFLEQSATASVPVECKPKLWKCYVDDILKSSRSMV